LKKNLKEIKQHSTKSKLALNAENKNFTSFLCKYYVKKQKNFIWNRFFFIDLHKTIVRFFYSKNRFNFLKKIKNRNKTV